jgi:hypothetical protein
VHPQYFDRQALTAGWREALLAQAVIATEGRGYSRHPQLERFRADPAPLEAVGVFLTGIADEADARGYRFDRTRILLPGSALARIELPQGQLDYEWFHLLGKLTTRSPSVAERWSALATPEAHPIFRVVDGGIAAWERPIGSGGR